MTNRLLPARQARRAAILPVAAALTLLLPTLPARAAPAPADPAAPSTSGHTVVVGNARFQVLSPTLIRLEYAADRSFEDGATFTVVDRNQPVPTFSVTSQGGYLTVQTQRLTLRYRTGSGPFTPENTSVSLDVAGQSVTAHPSWSAAPGSCAFGTGCQAEDAQLFGGESVNYDHTGYTGRGFAADYGQVSARTLYGVTGVPAAGDYSLQVRYANGGTVTRTLSVLVNGAPAGQLDMPPTGNWDAWGTATVPVHLAAGTDAVATACLAGDGCNTNIDTLAVTAPGAAYPAPVPSPPPSEPGQLGGWTRGLDAYANQAGTDVTKTRLHPGILNRRGWSLLEDTYTALRTADGWATPRPARQGAYQDGYFFGYGHDYPQALRDLRAITGPAVLLPQWAFGVWFSKFQAYTTEDYEQRLLPAFRANNVPIDALVVDTDWKSPQQWDGWNWNPNLFPDPQAFLDWARQQGLKVALNVHAGIDASDPRFASAQQAAQGRLQRAAQCFSPQCYRFDWADRDQAGAWFGLHQQFEQQGVRQWWLDWCCTDSVVDMPGLTPDSWINERYRKDLDARGVRGFSFARQGASFEDYRGAPASGPWGEHRSTMHFTGDTDPTWASLAADAQLTPAEASIGQPYVSHDVGSFKGKHLTDDLYARWVQLGAFQPVLRLHSDHGDRLPWEYGAAQRPAADFLRLREALVPYTYTLAAQAQQTGLPITRPLYLDYPELDAAYANPTEYLYGPDVLVAPVTSPGEVATQSVWFPPGRWVDYFTGATYTGPGTASLLVPMSRMPVFVRAGGVVPERPGAQNAASAPASQLTLKAYAGGDGRFDLYSDAGEGLGYQQGQFAVTAIRYKEGAPGGRAPYSTLTVGADRGRYPGQPPARAYDVHLADVSAPDQVLLNGAPLGRVAPGGGPGWWYDGPNATLHVRTAGLPTSRSLTIEQLGGHPVDRAQSAAVSLALDPPTPTVLDGGASTTVSATVRNEGPAAITGTQLSLTAPEGWTVSPSIPVDAGDIPAGGSAVRQWTVTAPAGGQATAALTATATFTSASNGSPGEVVTSQGPAALLPPTIISVEPTSASAGTIVTITGTNFGAVQGSSYVFFVDGDTSWGAPFDAAEFHVNSWSDTRITFTVPTPSGPDGIWHVTPGTTAYVSVTTAGGSTAQLPIQITG